MAYINHASELQALAEATCYADVEVILIDVLNRLDSPEDLFSTKEILAWAAAADHLTLDDRHLLRTLLSCKLKWE